MKTHKKIRAILLCAMFLISAVLLAACAPSYDPPKSNEELYGATKDLVYTNTYLGFSLTYPAGWTILDDEQINELWAQGIEQIKAAFTDAEEAEKAVSENIPVEVAFRYPLGYADGFNDNFNMIIKEAPAQMTANIKEAAESIAAVAEEASGSLKYEQPQIVTISGVELAVMDATQNALGFETRSKQILFARKNYLVICTLSAGDAASLEEIGTLINAFTFTEI
ncbi:MAG: hypothetical protein AAGU74_06020 [Bacillota bacterium]